MRLEVRKLCAGYGASPVLNDISFCAEGGERIAVLGPNGAGKTTLFRALLGFLPPISGEILLDGKSLSVWSRRALAGKLAYIPQSAAPAFDHSVLDCVLMAKAGSLGVFSQPTREDEKKALSLLERLGIGSLAGRSCRRISGGEAQLMLLARALMQDARLLIMDEPTASLDVGNALRVTECIRALSREGYTVLFSTHDPNQALHGASRVLALSGGGVLADGASETVLSADTLRTLYGAELFVGQVETERGAVPVCVPLQTEAKP